MSDKRTQRALVRTGEGLATAAVVEERVHGFLEHALFVTNDDLRSIELHEALQTVVTVDHATIEIVQVGSRETAAIQAEPEDEVPVE